VVERFGAWLSKEKKEEPGVAGAVAKGAGDD